MRALAIACLIAFGVGLGAVVAYRMSTEAMAVVVGVVCGVSASIPVAVLVLFAARQSQREGRQQTNVSANPVAYPGQPQQPMVVMVPMPTLGPGSGYSPYSQFGWNGQVQPLASDQVWGSED